MTKHVWSTFSDTVLCAWQMNTHSTTWLKSQVHHTCCITELIRLPVSHAVNLLLELCETNYCHTLFQTEHTTRVVENDYRWCCGLIYNVVVLAPTMTTQDTPQARWWALSALTYLPHHCSKLILSLMISVVTRLRPLLQESKHEVSGQTAPKYE